MSAIDPLEPYVTDPTWPQADLEPVNECPFCGGKERSLACDGVQDWAFHAAPGEWQYCRCQSCDALYLNSRPTIESIGRAYSTYYTHHDTFQSPLKLLKRRIKNEYFSYALQVNLSPRLSLPRYLSRLLLPLKSLVVEQFGLSTLARLSKGKLLDMGCGNGEMLQFAEQMGWDVMGLELDPAAVESSKQRGLNILQGGYERLDDYPSSFDCIIFSHVLEHVHKPLEALTKIKSALKPGGVLLLSCPNSMSKAGEYFGRYWRGLEAPRHIAIPSVHFLRQHLCAMGFSLEQRIRNAFPTIRESMDIQRKALSASQNEIDSLIKIRNTLGLPSRDQVDFIEFICIKRD
jgi:2-polyprenyl-3-methyl-5-hydroxy-6-metoxy-1,4-benzoquinol methylase